MQSALAEQIGQMRLVDRTTLGAVVEEFLNELEQVGLAFPGGIEGALSIMDGHISATAANRLRRLAGASAKADPWDRLDQRWTMIACCPCWKRKAPKSPPSCCRSCRCPRRPSCSASLPGEKARRVAYAVSLTGNVDPETVRRIGQSLASQLDTIPPSRVRDGAGRTGRRDPERLARRDPGRGSAGTGRNRRSLRRKGAPRDLHLRPPSHPHRRRATCPRSSGLWTASAGHRACRRHHEATMPRRPNSCWQPSQRLAQALREEMAERGQRQGKGRGRGDGRHHHRHPPAGGLGRNRVASDAKSDTARPAPLARPAARRLGSGRHSPRDRTVPHAHLPPLPASAARRRAAFC